MIHLDPLNIVILMVAGAGGGFIAGLVGVGGGIVFAPVLFFFFQSSGSAAVPIAPLTVGTSLLCTLIASSMSAWQHHDRASVNWATAIRVGLMSSIALYLTVSFVTSRTWYDRFAFQLVFGCLLFAVAVRMLLQYQKGGDATEESTSGVEQASFWTLGGIGSAAGTIAALAGVGGGIVMVPAFHQVLRYPMRVSVGTSSGSIIIISAIGVVTYAVNGWSTAHGGSLLGYVDVTHGLLLALPAIPGAHFGAKLAHRVSRRLLRTMFGALAAIVGGRMLLTALSGI